MRRTIVFLILFAVLTALVIARALLPEPSIPVMAEASAYGYNVRDLDLPTVTAPEGKVFSGWFRLDTAADGSMEYTQIFAPDADGKAELPAGTKLQPMTLYALFENVSNNGGNE